VGVGEGTKMGAGVGLGEDDGVGLGVGLGLLGAGDPPGGIIVESDNAISVLGGKSAA
jgi:hypothetical protein